MKLTATLAAAAAVLVLSAQAFAAQPPAAAPNAAGPPAPQNANSNQPPPSAAAPGPADPAVVDKGKDLFTGRCAGCHLGGAGPAVSVLAAHKPAEIVDILTNGPMQPMAAGLSDDDKAAIAAYLTSDKAVAPPAAG